MTAPADEGARWQPIESAPKDGTRVLAVVARHRSRGRMVDAQIVIAHWHQPGNPSVPGHWTTGGITHWMPLPPAPPQSGESE